MFLDNLKPFFVVLLLVSGSIPLSAQEKEKESISETGDKSATSQPIEKLKFDKKSVHPLPNFQAARLIFESQIPGKS